ncbi:MAG: hypothetical protein SCK57_03845 [Bacillota bacterium]|nr:hypothetical protein [Bacillota bacterium]
MEMLDQEFLQQRDIRECRTVRFYKSKKNEVRLLEVVTSDQTVEKLVLKTCRHPERMKQEAELVNALHKEGVAVPRLFYQGENHLVFEYIDGLTLCDLFQDQEAALHGETLLSADTRQAIGSLVQWLWAFYRAGRVITGRTLLMKDVNLRNFLLAERLYGVDFEDCSTGQIEEDVGRLCAYVLTYDPIGTAWKQLAAAALCRHLSAKLGLDVQAVHHYFRQEILEMENRRKIPLAWIRLCDLKDSSKGCGNA